MSASDSVVSVDPSGPPAPVKRKRFAGERAGAWLFAASFSVGIWGLALKVLGPSHPHPRPAPAPVTRYAILAPSGADDGRATVVWATGAVGAADGYPVIGGVPVVALSDADVEPPAGSPSTN